MPPPTALDKKRKDLRRAIEYYRSCDQHDVNGSGFLLNTRYSFTDKEEDPLEKSLPYLLQRGLLPPEDQLAQLFLDASPKRLVWLFAHAKDFMRNHQFLLRIFIKQKRADLLQKLLAVSPQPIIGLLSLTEADGALDCAYELLAALKSKIALEEELLLSHTFFFLSAFRPGLSMGTSRYSIARPLSTYSNSVLPNSPSFSYPVP